MKKPSYIPVIILLVSLVCLGLTYTVEDFGLQAKLGILSKIGLLVGILSLWLLTLLPLWKNKQESNS